MMQIVTQTDEEKMAMYMKLPKEEIIKMLIQCNKIIDNCIPQNCAIKNNPKQSYCEGCGCKIHRNDQLFCHSCSIPKF